MAGDPISPGLQPVPGSAGLFLLHYLGYGTVMQGQSLVEAGASVCLVRFDLYQAGWVMCGI